MRNWDLDLWVFAALSSEVQLLVERLDARAMEERAGLKWYLAQKGRMKVGLGVTGVGVASAAFSLGFLLGSMPAPKAVMVGSCGALPDSGLEVGDLVVASSECFSELGVLEEPGVGNSEDLKGLGISQVIPLNGGLGALLWEAASRVGRAALGGLLTVAGVSADMLQATARRKRFGALAENMEGYALALAAQRMKLEASEIRGVSNRAGQRQKTLWELERAQNLAQEALMGYLGEIPP
ncbi:MAG: futalosine hydrolase [bacterium]